MPAPRTYATAEAFRRALEERLKRAALTDRVDLIRADHGFDCSALRRRTIPYLTSKG